MPYIRTVLIAISLFAATSVAMAENQHLFVCRSPLLAFDFWNSLHDLQNKGVKITPQIAQEICDGMKAGTDPQCIRIEGENLKPVASGWQGAIAMSDGPKKVWFRYPDSMGWIHPDYYVSFVNKK